MKKLLYILLTFLVGLMVLTGCRKKDDEIIDEPKDVDEYVTILKGDEEVDLYVTHDEAALYLYYEDSNEFFGQADLPLDELHDDYEIKEILLTSNEAENYSMLYLTLSHIDETESHILWLWTEDNGFVYQPVYSYFYQSIIDDSLDFTMYEGTWYANESNLYPDQYIIFNDEGGWQLYSVDGMIDEGYLYIIDNIRYVYSFNDGAITGGTIELQDGILFISTTGYYVMALEQVLKP